jgi:hypothetical protein
VAEAVWMKVLLQVRSVIVQSLLIGLAIVGVEACAPDRYSADSAAAVRDLGGFSIRLPHEFIEDTARDIRDVFHPRWHEFQSGQTTLTAVRCYLTAGPDECFLGGAPPGGTLAAKWSVDSAWNGELRVGRSRDNLPFALGLFTPARGNAWPLKIVVRGDSAASIDSLAKFIRMVQVTPASARGKPDVLPR